MAEVGDLFQLKNKIWFYSPLLNTNTHSVSDSDPDPEPDGSALILVGWTRIPGSRRAKMAHKNRKKKPMRIRNTAYRSVSRVLKFI
jgi:hypothetical protein